MSELKLNDPFWRVFRVVDGLSRYEIVKGRLSAFAQAHPEHQGVQLLLNPLKRIPRAVNEGDMDEARRLVGLFKWRVDHFIRSDTGEYIEHFIHPDTGEHTERSSHQELGKLCEQLESMPASKEQLIWDRVQRFHHQGADGQTLIEEAHSEMVELNATWVEEGKGEHVGGACVDALQRLKTIGEHDRAAGLACYQDLKERMQRLDDLEVHRIWEDLHEMTSIARELYKQGWEIEDGTPDVFPQVRELKRWRAGPLTSEQVPTAEQLQRASYSLVAGSIVVPFLLDCVTRKLSTPLDHDQRQVLEAVKAKLETGRLPVADQLPQKEDGQPLYKEIIPYLPTLADKCKTRASPLVIKPLQDGEPAARGTIYITTEPQALQEVLGKEGLDIHQQDLHGIITNQGRGSHIIKRDGREHAWYELIQGGDGYQEEFLQCWNGESIRMVIDLRLANKSFVVAGVPETGSVFVSIQPQEASLDITGARETLQRTAEGRLGEEKREKYQVYAYGKPPEE